MSGRPQNRAGRAAEAESPAIDAFRGQHLDLARKRIEAGDGHVDVTIDEAESPLAWLARRRGRDGRPLIALHQLQAGERLRSDFTRARMMPNTTSNWSNPAGAARGGAKGAGAFTETMLTARQRVRRALDAAGPEFSGLLLDVCCFLKKLDDIERERAWPARSAKIVLRLALDRLARHYGLAAQIRGPAQTALRTWVEPGEAFVAGDGEAP
ncbi:MAG TPA: DUF6456 domain-containing protein [Pseudolabrys sp.]|nr:DUF6456 domain-containing protein [Pseudolabrys sp.]